MSNITEKHTDYFLEVTSADKAKKEEGMKHSFECLFQLKSIPRFHFKSIPFWGNKKGYFDFCWGTPTKIKVS